MTISLNRSLSVLQKPDYKKAVQQALEHPFQKVTEKSFRIAQDNVALLNSGCKPGQILNLVGQGSSGALANINHVGQGSGGTNFKVNKTVLQNMYEKVLRDPDFNWRESDLFRLHPEYVAAMESKLNLPATVKKSTNLPAVVNPSGAQSSSKGFLGSLLGRLKNLVKTPKGKLGLAIAAATTLVTAGTYLYARNKEHVGPVSDSSPINDLANSPVNGKMAADGSYMVGKGDNMWCIARATLMEIHKDEKDYKPTDVDIMQYMEKIMQLNNLQYEKDSYKVVIQPNQSLKLVA